MYERLVCFRCNRTPEELDEYITAAAHQGVTPDQYVLFEEGTLNPKNGHFACTSCYIEIGQPVAPSGWIAP